MRMTLNGGALGVLTIIFVSVLLNSNFSYAVESDINCLKAIKGSLEDPNNYLSSSWNFNNNTEGFICRFTGIDCWHPDENRVLNIRLSGMGLKGEFPRGIINCTTMTGLDLSSNKFYGTIPSDISKIVKFVTSLDLSANNLSGEIPVNLSNCSFLNILKLENNQLTGQIPGELGRLDRIKTFSVANNRLTGQVPEFSPNASITAESYANNAGLCGKPLPVCRVPRKKTKTGIIVGAAIGGVTLAALGVLAFMLFFVRRVAKKKKEDDPEGNKWAKSIKGAKAIKAR